MPKTLTDILHILTLSKYCDFPQTNMPIQVKYTAHTGTSLHIEQQVKYKNPAYLSPQMCYSLLETR